MIGKGVDDLDSEISDIPDGLLRQVRFLFFPDKVFTEKKFHDHRLFTAMNVIFLSFLVPGLWIWDYVTDPVHANSTIGLRLFYLLYLLLLPLVLSPRLGRRFFEVIALPSLLIGETLFCVILTRLDTGMVFGVGGFMYVLFAVVFVTQSLTLRYGIACIISVAALPQLLALTGLMEGFLHAQYAVLIWPGTAFAALTQVVLAHHYLVRYILEQKLKSLSHTDSLTGVHNRRYFTRFLERSIMRAQRTGENISLLLLDIDFFKSINDEYGHPTGDLVIRRMSQNIQQEVARAIDVIARIGGEEFAVVLPGTAAMPAAALAERIRARVAGEIFYSVADQPFRVSVSIGVAERKDSDSDYCDIISRADEALYAAKAAGRNRVIVRQESRGSGEGILHWDFPPVSESVNRVCSD
jgi:diguanylate cyclase (GGDEF)-like protein